MQTTVNAGHQAALLDFPALFGNGNTVATIEFDKISGYEDDPRVGYGTASLGQSSSRLGWEMGPYNSPNMLFTSLANGAYNQSTQNWTSDNCRGNNHFVITINKVDATNFTWSATYTPVGDPVGGPTTKNLMGGGYTSLPFAVTDPRGINTFRFNGSSYDNWPRDVPANGPYADCTIDNIVIKDIGVGPSWPNYLPGDFNKDGQVGPEDFGILKDNFGVSALPHGSHDSWTLGDANDDGQIGPEDFGLLKDNFGLSGGPTGAYPLSNVPEPATLALLVLGGLLAARKNRR